jgi:hypothetical protein
MRAWLWVLVLSPWHADCTAMVAQTSSSSQPLSSSSSSSQTQEVHTPAAITTTTSSSQTKEDVLPSSQTQEAPTPAAKTTRASSSQKKEDVLPLEERPQLVQDAFQKNTSLYYFGLGSNMLREKVVGRSSDGQGDIQIQDFQAAVVHGHRLAFNLRGFAPLEPGMGSLEPLYDANDKTQPKNSQALLSYHSPECHGALIKLSPIEYERVMKSEGIGSKKSGYREVVVTAVPYDTSQPPVQAICLTANPHVKLNKDPSPSVRYMNILRQGAAELQLKPCYQEFLAQHPVQKTPMWMKRLAVQNLIFTFTIGKLLNNWRGLSRLQSWFLFRVYVNGSAGKVACAVSNVLTAFILLPGACLGMLFAAMGKLLGKEPSPMLQRMTTFLKDDTSSSTSTSTSSTDNASKKQDEQVAEKQVE